MLLNKISEDLYYKLINKRIQCKKYNNNQRLKACLYLSNLGLYKVYKQKCSKGLTALEIRYKSRYDDWRYYDTFYIEGVNNVIK